MAIYKRDIVDINLETGNIHRSFLKHSIGYLDQAADHFGIRVLRNGEPVDLTGVTVQGIFMPPQGNPIAITTGNIIEGNVAEVVLPQACYNYDGQFCLSIKLVDATNAITGTMRIVDGMVDNTHASGTVAPTGSVPTYQEILAVYDDMVDALADVASYAENFAPEFVQGTANAAGSFVMNDGVLYLLPDGHTAGTTWANTTKTQANVGGQLSDLKSAFDVETKAVENNSLVDLGNKWITFKPGYYRIQDSAVSYHVDSNNYVCAISPCQKGDTFTAHVYGSTGVIRAWAVLDSSMTVLSYASQSVELNGAITISSATAAFIVFNNTLASLADGYSAIKGRPLKSALSRQREKDINGIAGVTSAIFESGIIKIPAVGTATTLDRETDSRYESAYLPVTGGQKVYVYAYGISTNYSAYGFVDSNLKTISRAGTNQSYDVVLTAPDDAAYVIVNSRIEGVHYLCVDNGRTSDKVDAVAKEIKNSINQLQNLLNVVLKPEVLTFVEGYIRTPAIGETTSLTRTTDSHNYYSAYAEIEPGQKVYVMTGSGTSNVRPYAFLDSEYTVLARSDANGGSYEDTAPSNSAYLVVNSQLYASPYAIILSGDESANNEESLNVGMFNKIGVCGYSMDSGYAYSAISGSSHSYTRRSRSWGAVLCNMHNVNFACYGVPSGTTCAPNSPWIGTDGAKCWQTETHGLPKLLADDPCDIYWFHMFENDAKKLGSTYLGTIDDIHEDYTQNPDTFYGNYGRIIDQIKAHAPNALFIFSYWSNGATGTTMASFVEAVEALAEHYGVPTINWWADSWWATWIRQHMVTNHPTFTDYAGWGKAADRLFGKCATDNWTYFKNFVPASDPE